MINCCYRSYNGQDQNVSTKCNWIRCVVCIVGIAALIMGICYKQMVFAHQISFGGQIALIVGGGVITLVALFCMRMRAAPPPSPPLEIDPLPPPIAPDERDELARALEESKKLDAALATVRRNHRAGMYRINPALSRSAPEAMRAFTLRGIRDSGSGDSLRQDFFDYGIPLQFQRGDSFNAVQEQIEKITGIPQADQALIYKGKFIRSSFGEEIPSHATIFVIDRRKGKEVEKPKVAVVTPPLPQVDLKIDPLPPFVQGSKEKGGRIFTPHSSVQDVPSSNSSTQVLYNQVHAQATTTTASTSVTSSNPLPAFVFKIPVYVTHYYFEENANADHQSPEKLLQTLNYESSDLLLTQLLKFFIDQLNHFNATGEISFLPGSGIKINGELCSMDKLLQASLKSTDQITFHGVKYIFPSAKK